MTGEDAIVAKIGHSGPVDEGLNARPGRNDAEVIPIAILHVFMGM
jgi:hypothetical protein